MEKIIRSLKVFILIITVILMSYPTNVSATDVWIDTVSNDNGSKTDNYIMTETISEDYDDLHFSVGVKQVVSGKNGYTLVFDFHFIYRNDNWYSKWYLNGMDNPMPFELVKNNVVPPKAFNACKPYVRSAREYPLR